MRIGSGSDHTVFLNHLGVPTIGLTFEGPYGVYHSMYDGFAWMNRFGDPGYRYHVLLSRIWGTLALRLANADLLPFDFAAYARHLRRFVADLDRATEKGRVDLSRVRGGLDAFEAAGRRLGEAQSRALASGVPAPDLARRVNRGVLEVERNWLDPDGLPGRPWFKHTLYAARFTYAHLELPGLTEAAEEGDWDRAARQAAILERAVARNTALLDGLSRELSAGRPPDADARGPTVSFRGRGPRASVGSMTARALALLALAALPFLSPACGGGGGSDGPTAPSASPTPTPAPAGSVRFTIDSGASRHPISPYIYGMNQPDWAGRSRGLRLGRIGGNRLTAYNWETNASNAGADYRHQNDDYLGGGDVPGEAVRPHVARAHAAGASMIVTVPMAGYVSADKAPSGDVNQTPDYLSVRFLESRAARGRGFSYPPDTGDRVVYQDEFVAWLESAFPDARRDPSRALFYSLDNEPDLWASTHARIRPTGKVTYAEMVQRTEEYASAIKAVAPWALVFGPVSYGWQGFVRLQDAPDHGGRDFLDFYLDSMRDAEGRARRRLLDVLDLHWYPEARGGGVRITEASNAPDVAAARVQAPRSLWDPGYAENSWISVDARVGRDPAPPAGQGEDRRPLPRHPGRDHRVQLRGRRPRVRRRGPGGRRSGSSAGRTSSPRPCGTSRAARGTWTGRSPCSATTTARAAGSATPRSEPRRPTTRRPPSMRASTKAGTIAWCSWRSTSPRERRRPRSSSPTRWISRGARRGRSAAPRPHPLAAPTSRRRRATPSGWRCRPPA